MGYDTTAWTTAGNTLTIGGTTLYANFSIGSTEATNFAAGYHEMLAFENSNYGLVGANPHLGNDPDPATSFTTADSAGSMARDLVPCLWYVPDNIYIDAISSLEGADNSTGDTTRMHCLSYTFTSGSTSALSSGTVLASSSDVTNSGNEQVYLSTWTVDSPSVAAGKVIVVTFESDSVNSDFSLQVRVKYHLV